MGSSTQVLDISCCFTGHRPEHLPWGRQESHPDCRAFYTRLADAVEEKIEQGCRVFYVGMARGVDLLAAQIVVGLRAAKPEWGIRLVAVCPYRQQAAHWSVPQRRMHQMLLSLADEVVVLEEAYTPYCFHQRNRYMVDRCGHMIAGFDGITPGGTSYTVQYARRKSRDILEISPYNSSAPSP